MRLPWRPLPPLPTARAAGAAVCIQNPDGIANFYILGGIPHPNSLERYSFRTHGKAD